LERERIEEGGGGEWRKEASEEGRKKRRKERNKEKWKKGREKGANYEKMKWLINENKKGFDKKIWE